MRLAFRIATAVAAGVAVAFLVLPVAALFLQTTPGALVHQLSEPVARDALVVSLKTSLIAHVAVVLVGTPAAWFLSRARFPGRALVLSLVELPLVLPPAVAGIALLAVFGRAHLLGRALGSARVDVAFTQLAVVLAIAFVESPFYVRGAVAAFDALDSTLVDAARTLGSGPARVFFRVAIPVAAGGLASASAVALARGLGEFGATIIFAGSLRGVTQTLPLAIYSQFEVDFDSAVAMSVLFVLAGAAILVALKVLGGQWTRSASTYGFRSVPSHSS